MPLTAILIYAAMQPGSFRTQRSMKINAPPEKIFAQINDFHRWEAWSPWEKIDPACKRTFGGTDHGVGAKATSRIQKSYRRRVDPA